MFNTENDRGLALQVQSRSPSICCKMWAAFQVPIPVLCSKNARRRTCPRRAQPRASVGDEIETALAAEFANEDVQRVINSFRAVRAGEKLEHGKGTPAHQRAHSFIEGLSAQPFHTIEDHPWTRHLEENWTAIAEELRAATGSRQLIEQGTNVWARPVVEAANAYGPDWRTLVLQDREWDAANCGIFPVTAGLLRDDKFGAPCVEAFFARQAPTSGIKLHTDDCNFVLTMHLGLDVPDKQAWIEVGGERRYWENGKCMVFDTSFFHRTMNESTDADRTVLLLRFWHPELTIVERKALQFLFKAIEDPQSVSSVLSASDRKREERQQRSMMAGLDVELPEVGSRAERRKSAPEKKSRAKRGKSAGIGFGK